MKCSFRVISDGASVPVLSLALDITANFKDEAGMRLSVDETMYMKIANRRDFTHKVTSSFQFFANGLPLERQKSIKILGLGIDRGGAARSRLRSPKARRKRGPHIIRHTTTWGGGGMGETFKTTSLHALGIRHSICLQPS